MNDIGNTPNPSTNPGGPRNPATVSVLLDKIRLDLVRERDRLRLEEVEAPEAIAEAAGRLDVAITGLDWALGRRTPLALADEARSVAARERLNARLRPILLEAAHEAGLDPQLWMAHIDGSLPMTDPELRRVLPEAFESEAVREAVAACRDLTLLPFELRVFAEAPIDLGFHGRPPARVIAKFPNWDSPLVPEGQILERWTIEDAADWTLEWPPESGDLKDPIDRWDAATADIWLRRHKLVEGHEAEEEDELVAFRQRRIKRNPLKVLAGLDEDSLFNLTDSLLCERLRREVMPDLLQARADLIQKGLERVACGYESLAGVRQAVIDFERAREAAFEEAFAGNHSWMSEWVNDWSRHLIGLYDWPRIF